MTLAHKKNNGITQSRPMTELEDMERRLDEMFGGMWPSIWSRLPEEKSWLPSIDVFEKDGNLVVKAELPGMKKEEIEISLHEGSLIISGERKVESQAEEGESSRSERFFGRFQRALALPKAVNANQVKANYKDGILTVTLPKTEESKPKQITVNAG